MLVRGTDPLDRPHSENDFAYDFFFFHATGLEIVQSYDLDDFDIIISRGGTAKMISANVTIPVVEVEISVYDILRAIKLAENYSNRFAIIGYPAITNCAKMLCNLLQYDIARWNLRPACAR